MTIDKNSRLYKIFLTTFFTALSFVSIYAAPFNLKTYVEDANGKEVQISMQGDEFSCIYETLDGYTLIEKADKYFFAEKSGNRLIASTVQLGQQTPQFLSTLEKHLRDTSLEYEVEIAKKVAEDESTQEVNQNWANIKDINDSSTNDVEAVEVDQITTDEKSFWQKIIDWILSFFSSPTQAQAPLGAPPKTPTTGTVLGLTIMVDFPIKGSTETEAQRKHPQINWNIVDSSINGVNRSKYNPSVRSFYKQMSCGKLDLTNVVIDYVLLDKPRSYYNDVTKSCGICGRLLIKDVFAKMKKLPNYETEIYPLMQTLSYDSGKRIRSLSVMFAGGSAKKWGQGLWAHKSTISGLPSIVSVDGTKMKFYAYQISPLEDFIKGEIYVQTFIHESGHMVCSFPDLYDYTHKSKGAGLYSYMASGDVADPYLAYKAGWITPIEVIGSSKVLELPADYETVYKFTNPSNAKEYYLVKYVDKNGRDCSMPGTGVIIYRCNEGGSNTQPRQIGSGANKWRQNYELSIIQADGKYDLECNVNSGEEEDFWTRATQVVNDTTVPNLVWKNNKPSNIKFSNFEEHGGYATCLYENTTPTISVTSKGFYGYYDKKTHKIAVTKVNPVSGVTVKYCKTKDGKYTVSNPAYSKPGEYITYFQATKAGYMPTNGFETVTILEN